MVNLGEQYLTKEMKKLLEQSEKLMNSEIMQERIKKDRAMMEAWEKSGFKSQFELLEKQIALVSPQSFPKPLEDIAHTKEKYSVRYKTPEEPPEPTDEEKTIRELTNELSVSNKKVLQERSKNKALQNRKKKPTTEMEMVELINRNLKKNGKCNNEACGREVKVDGETIKRWIREFGLTRYATNPDHRK